MAEQQHHSDEGEVHAHISPTTTYIGIFVALVVLTVLTYAVSFVHLGRTNLLVAVVIATIKASLVVLFFMHLKYDSRFNSVVFLGSLLFLAIFLGYTLNDTDQRGEFGEYGRRVLTSTGEWAPGGLPLEPKPGAQNTDAAGAGAIERGKEGPEATMNQPAEAEGAEPAVAGDAGAKAVTDSDAGEESAAQRADEATGEALEDEPNEAAKAKPSAAQGTANTAADPASNEADPAAADAQDPAADE